MSFPYRNLLKRTKDWKIDKNYNYDQLDYSNRKPRGLWYAIKDCLFKNDPEDKSFGEYMFELKVDTKCKCICIISNFDELKKFQRKYAFKFYFNEEFMQTQYEIDWDKVSKDYCGFEIKNYYKIKKQIEENYKYNKYKLHNQYDWVSWFDYSSGCIWDLKAVKNVSYFRKISKGEREREREKYNYHN